MTGTIKKLTDKFFGFITPDDGQKDVFFHSSAVMGTQFEALKEGDKVSFEIEDSPKGPRAANVQLA